MRIFIIKILMETIYTTYCMYCTCIFNHRFSRDCVLHEILKQKEETSLQNVYDV